MLSKMRSGRNNIFVYILFALLAIGLIGFGANNGGLARTSFGKLGETEISAREFTRAVQNQTNQLSQQFGRSLTQSEAEQLGVFNSALSQVVTSAALLDETTTLGLSVGDVTVANEIRSNPGFRDIATGEFTEANYRNLLDRNGYSTSEFEAETRGLLSRSLLETALFGGISLDETQPIKLGEYAQETREFEWAAIDSGWLPSAVEPASDEVLKTYYTQNEARFTLPETRDITYIQLDPAVLMDAIDIPEADLRTAYEAAIDRYTRPALRIVDRLVLADQAQADLVRAAIEDGSVDFDAMVEARGLSVADVSLGDVTENDLEADIAKALFANEELGVFGPFDSLLGPEIYRVNAAIAGDVTSFEDAKAELEVEARLIQVQGPIAEQIELIDDLLASGATLEEIAAETQATLGQIDMTLETSEGIAAYDAFRSTALSAKPNDFAELFDLSDGGSFALRLNETRAPMLLSFEDAKEDVIKAWTAKAELDALELEAQKLANVVQNGTRFSSLGLTPSLETVSRSDFLDSIDPALTGKMFDLAEGETAIHSSGTQIFIARLNDVIAFDPSTEENKGLVERVKRQMEIELSSDLAASFASSVELTAGLSIDQAVLEAFKTQIFTGVR